METNQQNVFFFPGRINKSVLKILRKWGPHTCENWKVLCSHVDWNFGTRKHLCSIITDRDMCHVWSEGKSRNVFYSRSAPYYWERVDMDHARHNFLLLGPTPNYNEIIKAVFVLGENHFRKYFSVNTGIWLCMENKFFENAFNWPCVGV